MSRPQSRVLDDQTTRGRLDAILAEQPSPLNAPEALLVIEDGQDPDGGLIGNIVNPAIDTGLGLVGQLERPFELAGDVAGEWAGERALEGQDISAPSQRTLRLRELGHGGRSIAEGTREDFSDITREVVRTGTREGLKLAVAAPIKKLSSGTRLSKAKAASTKARRNYVQGKQHGNYRGSTRPHHVYRLEEIETGEHFKTGISGQKLQKSGASPRANPQVSKSNKAAGYEKYEAKVINKEVPSRREALDLEQADVDKTFRETGAPPPGNKLPLPSDLKRR